MLLFCAKTIARESHDFELARLKKEKHFSSLATLWFRIFVMIFHTTGCCSSSRLVLREAKMNRMLFIKAYKFAMSVLSLHIESSNS